MTKRRINMRTERAVRRLLVGVAVLLPLLASLTAGIRRAWAEPGTQSDLRDVNTGEKKGRFVIAPNGSDHGTFFAEVTVNIYDLEPNTTYQVWRAIDFVPDGVYEPMAPGAPWAEIATITTSAGGAGEAHFIRESPLPSGFQFDLLIQVRRNDGATVALQSEVMTITVK
jgi:hypothetical protein